MAKPNNPNPWNKGKKLSLEHREKLRLARLNKKFDPYKKRVIRKCSGCRKKISLQPIDVKRNKRSCSLRCRSEWMRKTFSGKNSFRWQGGKTKKSKLLRCSARWRKWRKAVFERDNYTCQFCGVRGVELHPDHIKPLSQFPKLVFEINNGRTLCVPCHKKTATWSYKAGNYGITK